MSGLRPELRAEIPLELAAWIAGYYTRLFESRLLMVGGLS
jgi:hypothetical protein